MAKCYVYAWKNVNNGKMNIGYKSPNNQEYTYITSLKNTEFWKDYSFGLLKKNVLFVGDESEENIAKSVEWFALKYAVAIITKIMIEVKKYLVNISAFSRQYNITMLSISYCAITISGTSGCIAITVFSDSCTRFRACQYL